MHDLIGQRLADEVYYYIQKGLLGPQLPNSLTTGEIRVTLPPGSADSEDYQQFVSKNLVPIWTESISLLSSTLHRFFQVKSLAVKLWFATSEGTINLKDLPSAKDKVAHWKIKNAALPQSLRIMQSKMSPLMFAVQSAKDPALAKIGPKDQARFLESKDEFLSNTLWRFLQLRRFIGADHKLTSWGKTLETALSSLDEADHELVEPLFVAVELMRFGQLNGKDMFPKVSGGPTRLSGEEKDYAVLISRVACLGKIHHKSLGYSGPLDRQLFSYRGLISAVRSTLREQVEVILVNLLLNGDVNRERDDWWELVVGMPFIDDNDCGLGIAVRTYLDDLTNYDDMPMEEAVEKVKAKGRTWFQHGHSFAGNLDKAFKLWDAVYTASQNAGRDVKDSKLFAGANEWLSVRR